MISSETGKLLKLIMHAPDEGIELVTPDKAMEYLYDDIVFLKKMKQEHGVFTKLIKAFIGQENVIDIEDLLTEVLTVEKVRNDLVDAICRFEECESDAIILLKLTPKKLAFTLITGKLKDENRIIFAPISNFIFCRDIGIVINDSIIVCEAARRARARESIICRYIFRNAALFSKYKILEVSSFNIFLESLRDDHKSISLEGGDLMMIHKDHLLIGASERTTPAAIQNLCNLLFHNMVVKTITSVSIPKERYCMHLDTIFTLIDKNVCIAFEPLVCRPGKLEVVQYVGSLNNKVTFSSLREMLLTVIPDLTFIPCGAGVSPYAEREQWTDGCNLFAIKEGVAVTYDRNHHTATALKDYGYQLIHARKLLEYFKSGKLNPQDVEKTIILIPSNELSRARGGTHCLTFPVSRA